METQMLKSYNIILLKLTYFIINYKILLYRPHLKLQQYFYPIHQLSISSIILLNKLLKLQHMIDHRETQTLVDIYTYIYISLLGVFKRFVQDRLSKHRSNCEFLFTFNKIKLIIIKRKKKSHTNNCLKVGLRKHIKCLLCIATQMELYQLAITHQPKVSHS